MNKEKQDFIEKLNGRFGLFCNSNFHRSGLYWYNPIRSQKVINIWQAKMMNGRYYILLSTFFSCAFFF